MEVVIRFWVPNLGLTPKYCLVTFQKRRTIASQKIKFWEGIYCCEDKIYSKIVYISTYSQMVLYSKISGGLKAPIPTFPSPLPPPKPSSCKCEIRRSNQIPVLLSVYIYIHISISISIPIHIYIYTYRQIDIDIDIQI